MEDSSTRELLDLFTYVFGQIQIPDFLREPKYYIYAALFVAIVLAVYFFVRRKRLVDQYIESGIHLALQPKNGEIASLHAVLRQLHDMFKNRYKDKKFFSFEGIIGSPSPSLLISIPREVYHECIEYLRTNFTVEDVTQRRNAFYENISGDKLFMEFELAKDFVFPVGFEKPRSGELFRKRDDWALFQLSCRPVRKSLNDMVDRYIRALKKGRNLSRAPQGCIGGCSSIVLPFFTLIGDILTLAVHGDAPRKNNDSEKSNEKQVEAVAAKKSIYGFSCKLRLILSAENEDNQYTLAEAFVDSMSVSNEDVNHFVVALFEDRLRQRRIDETYLSFLPSDTVDVLNEHEISQSIMHLLGIGANSTGEPTMETQFDRVH